MRSALNSLAACRILRALPLFAVLYLSTTAPVAASSFIARHMPQVRPLLMGDAYVAVGDESTTVFYNPAGIARLPENSWEIGLPLPIMDLGPIFADSLTDPEGVSAEYQDLTASEFRDLLGTRLYSNLSFRLPFVVLAERGTAYGFGIDILTNVEVQGNPVLPSLHLELHADAITFGTWTANVTDRLSVGLTAKIIDRIGLDKVFTFGELFASGTELDLENNPYFEDLINGTAYVSGGIDLGFIYRFPFWESWQPRFGAAMLNIGGYDSKVGLRGIEFGKRLTPYDPPLGGQLPQLNSVGFAISPTYWGIRYTLALDVVDVTRNVLPGDDWVKRTRAGLEVGIGIRPDNTALFSILAGLNAGHPSVGVLSRIWIFDVGFGTYTVELGNEAGDSKEERLLFQMSIRI